MIIHVHKLKLQKKNEIKCDYRRSILNTINYHYLQLLLLYILYTSHQDCYPTSTKHVVREEVLLLCTGI